MSYEGHNTLTLAARTYRHLDEIDAMPADLRQCVHEFGYAIVRACVDAGVREPRKIRQLVKEIWDGARQPQQHGGAAYNSTMKHLDWLLLQAGAQVSAVALARFLHGHGWTIAPLCPTTAMLNASLAEVSGFSEVMSKREKHRRRLEAALKASSMSMFPHLYTTEQLIKAGAA